MNQKKSVLSGALMYALFLVFMLTGAPRLQGWLGLWGLILTEAVLAAFAVGAAILEKKDLGKVFPLTPPPPRDFFGSALLYGGAWCAMIALTSLLTCLFPQSAESSADVAKLIASMPPALAILVVALLPAICEELLFRGYLLSAFKPIGKKWTVIVLVGVLFGIGHLDPLRFLPTAVLGMLFAYLAFETGSIFLGMLFHFLNNTLSVVTTVLSGEGAQEIPEMPPFSAVIGSALFYLGIGAILLFLGWHLLHGKKLTPRPLLRFGAASGALIVLGILITGIEVSGSAFGAIGSALFFASIVLAGCFVARVVMTRKKTKTAVLVLVCTLSFLLFIGGIALTVLSLPDPIYAATQRLSDPEVPITETVTVEEEGVYQLTVSALCSNCTVKFAMRGEEEAVVAYEGDSIAESSLFRLREGVYTVTYSIKKTGGEETECLSQIMVRITPIEGS